MWPNYAAVPGLRVLLPLVVVDADDLRVLQEITRPAAVRVCELVAPRTILERRIIDREPNEYWTSRLMDFIALYHDRDDHEMLRDFQITTHPGSIERTAAEVIRQCGWSSAGGGLPAPIPTPVIEGRWQPKGH